MSPGIKFDTDLYRPSKYVDVCDDDTYDADDSDCQPEDNSALVLEGALRWL